MKVISCYDLLLADPLKHMNIFDLVHLDNAEVVYDVLETLGMDVAKPVHIYAAQHRTLAGDVKIGYLFAGELDTSRSFLKGKYAHPEDLLIAASIRDKSLYEHLHEMSTTCTAYGGVMALDDGIPPRPSPDERFSLKSAKAYEKEYVSEESKILAEITQLEDILFDIRGEQFNPDGSVKTLEEYTTPKPAEKLRKKYKKRKGKSDESV
jgi:hypothetical protein